MAIFGKKKDKAAAGQDGSPVLDNSPSGIPQPGSQIRGGPQSAGGHAGQPLSPQSLGHASKGSLSGMGGVNGGNGYGPNGQGGMTGPPGGGILRSGPPTQSQINGSSIAGPQGQPPGAASGFKFGGPPRSDLNNGPPSGIPGPGASQMRGVPQQGAVEGGPVSGLPTSSGSGMPMQGGPGGERPRTQQVVYPWSQRSLTMNPPRFLDESRQAAAVGAVSPSPFPRYGHAANSSASASGEVYLFGGLVRESVKNDLYVVYVDRVIQPPAQMPPGAPPQSAAPSPSGGVNATLVQTTGEIPPPRVGHATVLVANVLILWGGDTKVRADDKQDEGLYLLNLSTREWTRVRPANDSANAGPVGRYGHTVSIVGSRFYVFGGQVDGTFMNDIWSFDLNSLKSTPTWELLTPPTDLPPKRTGHASVTHKDKIYIFGGTDGQYHYNDTWCFDITTNTWQELSCIGYIPVPREGHAACLVDDIMYIFGGRGVDGKDLGDLASFRISNQRWYMFANMGPSPSGRSGHALTAFQNKVVVLGGESFTGSRPDDPAIVYALDTGKIKYPPEGASKTQAGTARKSGTGTGGSVDGESRSMSPADGAISPTQRGTAPMAAMARQIDGTQQSPSMQQQAVAGGVQSPPPQQQPSQSAIGAGAAAAGVMTGVGAAALPTSPTQKNGALQTQSPISAGHGATASPPPQMRGPAAAPAIQAAVPPTVAYNGPRSQRSIENMRNGGTGTMSPTSRGYPQAGNNAAVAGTERTMSPTPQDGFHYGNMPNGTAAVGTGGGAPGRMAAQPGEVEVLRKREGWMKAALALAVKKGFVTPEVLDAEMPNGEERGDNINLEEIDTGAAGSEKERIVRALVSLKAQLAQAKATIAQQAQSETDRIGESDRARLAALSEAAFYRAKLDAFETGNVSEAERVQRERSNDMERQLSVTLNETADLERQVARTREELKLEQRLRASAEDRLSEATKRAMAAEAAQLKVYDELAVLQKTSQQQEAQLRDHREKVISLSGLVAKHQSNHEEARGQLDEYRSSSDRHGAALRDMQAALAAAAARSSEHERMHHQYRDLSQQHESTIARIRSELDAKTVEADRHGSRVVELDSLVSRHREEADTHRNAVAGSLSQVLAFHKQQQSTRSADGSTPIPNHVNERLRALQEEADGLRTVHAEGKQAADQAHAALNEMRERNFALEKQQSGLRGELSAMRSQLTIALQEVARLKDMTSMRDMEVRDSKRQAEAGQVKHALLRQFMSDRGVAVPGDDELSNKGGVTERRLRALEEETETQSRQMAETEHRLRDASSKVEELTRELDHARSRADRGVGSAGTEEAQQRASLAERELQDAHTSYRERTAQLEHDYQTAVQFVKGSEKMLRRMKDELTKYKGENGSLQNELMNARAGMYSPDNTAAKDVEALRLRMTDLTRQHDETTAENRELERKVAALIAEHKDFRDKNRAVLDAPASSSTQTVKVLELERQIASLDANLTDVRRELQETHTLNTHLSTELNAASRSAGGGVNGVSAGGASASSMARNLNSAQVQNEQLRVERDALSQRLHETEDKLQLLLANDSEVGAETAGRDSNAFSISSELDKWERDRAGMPDTLSAAVQQHNAAHAGALGS